MKYDAFLKAVAERGGPEDRTHADQAARTVLGTLGERLAGNEPRDLASQLPAELQGTLSRHAGAADLTDDLDAFCRRVAEREAMDCTPEQALSHARAVLGTIATFVSAGEIDDLKDQLPAGYAPLFEAA